MNFKAKYRLANHENTPLYFQPFWLDIVAGDDWNVWSPDESVERSFVFVQKGNQVVMPAFTQFLGPNFTSLSDKNSNAISDIQKWTSEALETLPGNVHLQVSTKVTDPLPYIRNKFAVSPRVTYIIPANKSIDLCVSEYRENIRREVRKAEKNVTFHWTQDSNKALEIIEKCDLLSTLKIAHHIPIFKKLVKACLENGKAHFAYIDQAEGQAFLFLPFDYSTMYYISSYAAKELKSLGAMSLLVSKAIERSRELGLIFDFEGSMHEGIERFFRSFGAEQKLYFELRRFKSPVRRFIYWWRVLR